MHWGFKVLFVIDKTLLRKKRNANVNKKNEKNAVSTGKYTILFFFLTLSYWQITLRNEVYILLRIFSRVNKQKF